MPKGSRFSLAPQSRQGRWPCVVADQAAALPIDSRSGLARHVDRVARDDVTRHVRPRRRRDRGVWCPHPRRE
jgi:hypothetical protein